jgi:hypothetical protein
VSELIVKSKNEYPLVVTPYTQTQGERRCVWFAGGLAVPAEGLCNAEGDLRESASERRNAEEAEPVRKGNHGSDEGDPKPPSVSEKEEGRGGRVSKNASTGTSRKNFCWTCCRVHGEEAWGCAPTRLNCMLQSNVHVRRGLRYLVRATLPSTQAARKKAM